PELLGIGRALGNARLASPRIRAALLPQRSTVLAADQLQGPARKALSRKLLALPEQQHTPGTHSLLQLARELDALLPLGRAERLAVPFRTLPAQAGIERRFAPAGPLDAQRAPFPVGSIARLPE